jgi:hypothetical protein
MVAKLATFCNAEKSSMLRISSVRIKEDKRSEQNLFS